MCYLQNLILFLSWVTLSSAYSSKLLPIIASYDAEISEATIYTPYSLQCKKYQYFQVEFPYPCMDMNISVTTVNGSMPEIYVSKALQSPTKRDLTWSTVDKSYLLISHWDPESSPGWYYIGIYNPCYFEHEEVFFTINVYGLNDSSYDLSDIYRNPKLSFNQYVKQKDYVVS
jgi:hypothetical protein